MAIWLPREAQWVELARRIRAAGICGYDSETVGHDPAETSPTYRAEVVVFSMALRTGKLHPRGYHRASGCTLPAAALTSPPIREVLEDAGITKVAHNATYDSHSAANMGVEIRGLVDTLSFSRVVLPGLKKHGLKMHMADSLGRTPMGKYKDLFARPRLVVKTRVKKMKETTCSCGEPGCRKRKGHERQTRTWEDVYEEVVEQGTELTPLKEIVPGHALFETLVQYASEDAEAALELHEWLGRRRIAHVRPPVPWYPGALPVPGLEHQ